LMDCRNWAMSKSIPSSPISPGVTGFDGGARPLAGRGQG
jgi:hypothetical protein